MPILGAVEAGGTKFVCGIGTETGEVLDRVSFPTEKPHETVRKVVDYFQDKRIEALGVGSFGPIDPNKTSPTYGYVTSTPKPHWGNFPFLAELQRFLTIPIGFDTDCNIAALGELTWGAAQGVSDCLYITVGTGIGAGAIVNGEQLHGLTHPEMGHILVRRHERDGFAGNCPYHGDCLEGMAAGPAIEKRWGVKGSELPDGHDAWEFEAYYLAQAIVNFTLTLSPQKIVIGGGVMKQRQLFPLVRSKVVELLNGYVAHEQITQDIDSYIVPPGLGDNAGLCGALALAHRTLSAQN
ncbi:MAG: fructokinase [Paenibacillus sp.]|jgi:fructokinase|nr:fructokinase [Paenibacillus sp.]